MRQVIEDWLNYTVVQNGQLRPEAVKLVRRRRRDRRGPPGALGRRRRAAVLPRPRPQRARRPRVLRQLLDNLVGNAIKYTAADQQPGCRSPPSADDEPGWVRIEVIDHGVGIPEGEEELIFEEFHRGPQSRAAPRAPGSASRSPGASSRCTAVDAGRAATPRAARPSPSPCPRPEPSGATSTGAGRLARPRCRASRCSGAGRRPSSRRTSTTRRTTRAGGVRR